MTRDGFVVLLIGFVIMAAWIVAIFMGGPHIAPSIRPREASPGEKIEPLIRLPNTFRAPVVVSGVAGGVGDDSCYLFIGHDGVPVSGVKMFEYIGFERTIERSPLVESDLDGRVSVRSVQSLIGRVDIIAVKHGLLSVVFAPEPQGGVVKMSEGHYVRFSVVDDNSNPIEGVRILISENGLPHPREIVEDPLPAFGPKGIHEGITDRSGWVTIFGLDPGNYEAAVIHAGYGLVSSGMRRDSTFDVPREDINVVMTEYVGFVIVGTNVDQDRMSFVEPSYTIETNQSSYGSYLLRREWEIRHPGCISFFCLPSSLMKFPLRSQVYLVHEEAGIVKVPIKYVRASQLVPVVPSLDSESGAGNGVIVSQVIDGHGNNIPMFLRAIPQGKVNIPRSGTAIDNVGIPVRFMAGESTKIPVGSYIVTSQDPFMRSLIVPAEVSIKRGESCAVCLKTDKVLHRMSVSLSGVDARTVKIRGEVEQYAGGWQIYKGQDSLDLWVPSDLYHVILRKHNGSVITVEADGTKGDFVCEEWSDEGK